MSQAATAVPINFSSKAALAGTLAENFAAFMEASGRLESSYSELQAQVADLRLALQLQTQENAELATVLQQIVQALPCGVLVLRGDGTISLQNAEAARLLALAAASLPFDPGAQALHSVRDFEQSCRAGVQEIQFRNSSSTCWVKLQLVPLGVIFSDAGSFQPSRMLILEDISARKAQEAAQEAARNDSALARMASMLAHEIRNPLASMEFFTDLLHGASDEETMWIQHLRIALRSLSGLVNNVLGLHGEALLERGPVHVQEELMAAVHLLQPIADQAGVHLQLQCDEPLPLLLSNRSALHQLLLNLGSNALRHSRVGQNVQLCAVALPLGGLQITVKDQGPGISPDVQRYIFEAGFSGTGHRPGLGLTVCQRLMQQHGGTIHVTSSPDMGSCFTLEFPAA